jgi:hypothetical protein
LSAQVARSDAAEMAATDRRIVHIEGRVDRLETDVSDIKAGVKELLGRPVSPGFGQVITTLLSTLAACAILAGFGEWRVNQAIAPVSSQVIENKKDVQLNVKELTETRIQQAVLLERSRWLEQRSSWETKTEKLH